MLLDVKGGGIVMHDHRHFWERTFGEIIAGAGPSLQGEGADLYKSPELGYPEISPGVAHSLDEAVGKVDAVRLTQLAKLFWDCLGVCMLSLRGVKDSTDLTSKCLGHAVGWEDFSIEEALKAGERVTNLMRLVYIRRGFKKEDELDISPKHLEPPTVGPAKGLSIGPYLPGMVDEYYRQMGWDVETGAPTADTLRRLNMEEFLEDVGQRR